MIQQLFYIPVLISLFGITIFIFSQSVKNKINLFFGLFTSSVLLWLSALFMADTSHITHDALLWTRIGLFIACLIPMFFLWFASVFPGNTPIKVKRLVLSAIPTVLLMAFAFSDAMVQGVEIKKYAANPTVVGTAYTAFFMYLVAYFGIAIFRLIRKLKTSSAIQKSQIKFVLMGTAFGVLFNVIFNFIFVILDMSGIGLLLGGPSVLVFVSLVTYAIVRHSLFDMRLIVARTVAYTSLLSALAVLYGAVIFAFSSIFFDGRTLPVGQQAFYVLAAVFLSFTLQPLKRLFDRVSNTLFYRDAYDPQDFLDNLNQVLVSTIDLQALLRSSSEIIERNMKAEYCAFSIHETSYEERRIIGNVQHRLAQSKISEVLANTPSLTGKVFVTDYLENNQKELKKVLTRNDVAILVKLTSGIEAKVEGVGYILLGQKKSGNPYNSQDIKVLEIVANELVIAIQNALRFEEISNFNVTLQQQIEQATRQLQHTNEKLRALDETKDDFISMASHQLRTPLTSVKGYLSMVLEGDAGKVDPKQEKLLTQAFTSSQRMVYLIADLLNVSRLRTGKFVIDPTPTNLAEIIEGEVDQLIETAAARDLKLTYDKPEDFPTLMFDETKIRQVIMNFIDNAIYYTPGGGHIKVALSETAQTVSFTVVDDGIGVPREEQHRLFSKFYRAGNARKARPDGTGLGLFMAKKVIIAQGGSIVFKSHVGKGSTFGFTFAKAKLAVPKQPTKAPEAETTVPNEVFQENGTK